MLVLSRKANQSIMIGNDVRILVVGLDRDQVKLGIEAPRHVPVHRFEVFSEIHQSDGSPRERVSNSAGPTAREPMEAGAAADARRN